MKVVGLTGGIGSGKTTVAQMFKDLGVPVYNSDIEAKALMHSSRAVRKAVVELLGKTAYKKNKLNRAYIAKKVFNDENLLKALNNIVHPVVREHFLEWVSCQDHPYVIQETALIFENENQNNYDAIILVTAPEDIRIQRVVSRDNSNEKEIISRIKNQLSDSEKIPYSSFVVENIDLKKTSKKVLEVNKALLEYT